MTIYKFKQIICLFYFEHSHLLTFMFGYCRRLWRNALTISNPKLCAHTSSHVFVVLCAVVRLLMSQRSAKVKTFTNWRTNHPKPGCHPMDFGVWCDSDFVAVAMHIARTTKVIAGRHIVLGCSTWILISPIKNLQIFYNNSVVREHHRDTIREAKVGRWGIWPGDRHSNLLSSGHIRLDGEERVAACHTIILMDRHYTQTLSRRGMHGMHVVCGVQRRRMSAERNLCWCVFVRLGLS